MKEFFKKVWAWIVSIPQDKLLHDYAGALICLYAFALLKLFTPYWPSLGVANILAVAALAGKEVYDWFHRDGGHSVECQDIAYGVFGVVKVDLALLLLAFVLA